MNIENNKIIAEFMGWKVQKDPTERFFGRYRNLIGTWYKEIDLAFHHDWNWLMEVVEKIEGIGKTELKFSVHFENAKLSSDIQVVYNACVEFIKWYNSQNSAN